MSFLRPPGTSNPFRPPSKNNEKHFDTPLVNYRGSFSVKKQPHSASKDIYFQGNDKPSEKPKKFWDPNIFVQEMYPVLQYVSNKLQELKKGDKNPAQTEWHEAVETLTEKHSPSDFQNELVKMKLDFNLQEDISLSQFRKDTVNKYLGNLIEAENSELNHQDILVLKMLLSAPASDEVWTPVFRHFQKIMKLEQYHDVEEILLPLVEMPIDFKRPNAGAWAEELESFCIKESLFDFALKSVLNHFSTQNTPLLTPLRKEAMAPLLNELGNDEDYFLSILPGLKLFAEMPVKDAQWSQLLVKIKKEIENGSPFPFGVLLEGPYVGKDEKSFQSWFAKLDKIFLELDYSDYRDKQLELRYLSQYFQNPPPGVSAQRSKVLKAFIDKLIKEKITSEDLVITEWKLLAKAPLPENVWKDMVNCYARAIGEYLKDKNWHREYNLSDVQEMLVTSFAFLNGQIKNFSAANGTSSSNSAINLSQDKDLSLEDQPSPVNKDLVAPAKLSPKETFDAWKKELSEHLESSVNLSDEHSIFQNTNHLLMARAKLVNGDTSCHPARLAKLQKLTASLYANQTNASGYPPLLELLTKIPIDKNLWSDLIDGFTALVESDKPVQTEDLIKKLTESLLDVAMSPHLNASHQGWLNSLNQYLVDNQQESSALASKLKWLNQMKSPQEDALFQEVLMAHFDANETLDQKNLDLLKLFLEAPVPFETKKDFLHEEIRQLYSAKGASFQLMPSLLKIANGCLNPTASTPSASLPNALPQEHLSQEPFSQEPASQSPDEWLDKFQTYLNDHNSHFSKILAWKRGKTEEGNPVLESPQRTKILQFLERLPSQGFGLGVQDIQKINLLGTLPMESTLWIERFGTLMDDLGTVKKKTLPGKGISDESISYVSFMNALEAKLSSAAGLLLTQPMGLAHKNWLKQFAELFEDVLDDVFKEHIDLATANPEKISSERLLVLPHLLKKIDENVSHASPEKLKDTALLLAQLPVPDADWLAATEMLLNQSENIENALPKLLANKTHQVLQNTDINTPMAPELDTYLQSVEEWLQVLKGPSELSGKYIRLRRLLHKSALCKTPHRKQRLMSFLQEMEKKNIPWAENSSSPRGSVHLGLLFWILETIPITDEQWEAKLMKPLEADLKKGSVSVTISKIQELIMADASSPEEKAEWLTDNSGLLRDVFPRDFLRFYERLKTLQSITQAKDPVKFIQNTSNSSKAIAGMASPMSASSYTYGNSYNDYDYDDDDNGYGNSGDLKSYEQQKRLGDPNNSFPFENREDKIKFLAQIKDSKDFGALYIRAINGDEKAFVDMMPFLIQKENAQEALTLMEPLMREIDRNFMHRKNHPNLPEMMLLLNNPEAQKGSRLVNAITAAISSLEAFVHTGAKVNHQTIQNWAKIGFLAHAFRFWRFDTQGGEESLFGKYGFKPMPNRPTDSIFQKGYLFKKEFLATVDDMEASASSIDDKTLIELRRGYLLVSHPAHGTLVVRNSSYVFGRDTMNKVAYYSPKAMTENDLLTLNPEKDNRFSSVLNDNYYMSSSQAPKSFDFLLGQVSKLKQDYAHWKFNPEGFDESGQFIGDKTPGLREILKNVERELGAQLMGGEEKPIPALAFVPPNLPVYEPYSFKDQKGEDQRLFEITPERFLEIQDSLNGNWSAEKYPNSDWVSFVQSGVNARAELVLVDGKKK
jgi:hypothetical protein